MRLGEDKITRLVYSDFQEKLETEKNVLDPASLIFFGDVIFEKNYAGEEAEQLRITKSLFDLAIGYAVIFCDTSDYKLTHELLNAAVVHLSRFTDNMQGLAG